MRKISVFIASLSVWGGVLSCSSNALAPEETACQSVLAGIDVTRTSISDGNKVLWTPGDALSLYDSGSGTGAVFTSSLNSESPTAEFKGNGAQKGPDGYYYAVYPAGAVSGWSGDVALFTIPNVQTAVKGQAPAGTMVMAARAESLDKGMMFSHKAAYVKFTVDGNTEPFVSFSVIPTVGKNISGGFKITMGTDAMALSNDGNAKRYQYVELRTADGNPFTAGTWYVAMYPGTYDEGLDFQFKDKDGGVCSVKGKGEKISVYGGDVLDLGTVKGLEMVNYSNLIGSVYDKDGDKGVIWKVDPAKGTALLLSAWSSPGRIKFCSGDATKLSGIAKDSDDGAANTAAILASDLYKNGGLTWAVTNCTEGNNGFGKGWYLPARYQLSELYDTYYGLPAGTSKAGKTSKEDISGRMDKTVKKAFDDAMASLGGVPVDTAGDSTGLWSSSLNSAADDAYMTRFNTTLYSQHKPTSDTQYVRCVKEIKL